MVMLNDMGCETVFSRIIGIPRTQTAGDGMGYLHGDHLGRHFETDGKSKNDTRDGKNQKNLLVDSRQVSRREYWKRLQVQFGAKSGLLIGRIGTRFNVFLGQGRERVV